MLTVERRETVPAGLGRTEDPGPGRPVARFADAAVLNLDLEGHVTEWNSIAEQSFGIASAGPSVLDRPMLFTAAEIAAGRPERVLQTALVKGRCQVAGWRTGADGHRFWAEILISPLVDDCGRATGFAALVRDTTDRKRHLDRLRAALGISHAVLGGIQPEQVLRLVVRRARALLQADGAHVMVRAPGSDDLLISVAEGWNARLLRGTNVPCRWSPVGLVVEPGRGQVTDSISLPIRRSRSSSGAARLGPTLAVPLARAKQRTGTLVVYNRVGGPAFCRRDLSDLRRLASYTVLALHHSEAWRDQRRQVTEEQARLWRVLQAGAMQSLDHVARGLASATGCCQDRSLREQLAGCIATVESVVHDVRNHVLGLPPSILEGRGLDNALLLLAGDLELRTGLATIAELEAEAVERLTARAGDVVQLVREGLSNVARHSHARCCRLSLHVRGDRAWLQIEDDGVGFVPDRVLARGHGLSTLRERVARMGGQLHIESVPKAGTRLQIAIPV